MKIIVDAMGGDNAPQAVVEGAVAAAKEYGMPSSPATWAVYPLDPSSQISGMAPSPGTAVICE